MIWKVLRIAVPFVWFGMVIAISFMEAPLKFQAEGITLPLGLGIGRLVFFALNKMEIACALILIFALWRSSSAASIEKILTASATVILLLQTVWLLPVLDARAEQVIAGTAQPFSNTHLIYIGFDAIKAFVLPTLGVMSTRRLLRGAK